MADACCFRPEGARPFGAIFNHLGRLDHGLPLPFHFANGPSSYFHVPYTRSPSHGIGLLGSNVFGMSVFPSSESMSHNSLTLFLMSSVLNSCFRAIFFKLQPTVVLRSCILL